MKSFLFFIVIFPAITVMAQGESIPYLISTDGILMNNIKMTSDSRNSITDTIPLTSARNIFAIGGINYNAKHFQKLIITDYILTIVHASGDTISLPGKEANLNAEMIHVLKGIQPNTKIFVEGILFTTKQEPDLKGHLILMSFFVR